MSKSHRRQHFDRANVEFVLSVAHRDLVPQAITLAEDGWNQAIRNARGFGNASNLVDESLSISQQ